MPTQSGEPAADPSAATQERVLRAQVDALYATTLSSTVADAVLAWALAGLFYWQLEDPKVLLWLALHVLQTLRYPLIGAYHRDPQAGQRSAFWARRHVRELLLYSATWGLAPWLFLPAQSLPLTALMMLVMLGLSSAGVPSVAPRWGSVLAFVLPMMLGLISALTWGADTTHLFLAACSVVYVMATLHFASAQHRLLSESLRTRFEKEALAEQLARQMAATQLASEEKTRFLAAASHDLRQPLQAIALFGAVLDKELAGWPAHAHARRLMSAVQALGTSLDTMLDVSRLDAGVIDPDLQDLPLNNILQALLPLFASRAEQKDLQLRIRASPLWVRSDPHLLQRLLSNLIENAIKYSVRGGVVVVARSRGRRVWIDVVDTGIGIAPEHIGRVFDEFYQVDNPGRDRTRGLGIGLSIVGRLSVLLGHPVRLHSRPGRGSRFRVVLPNAPPGLFAQPPDQPPMAEPIQGLPRRVLVVDDEADIGEAAKAFLSSWGVQVQVVSDEPLAAEALQRARNLGTPFDAMLCDFRLGDGADGLEASLRLQRQHEPFLPLLLITGETAPEQLQRVRASGVPVLFKPVDPEQLLRTLASLHRP